MTLDRNTRLRKLVIAILFCVIFKRTKPRQTLCIPFKSANEVDLWLTKEEWCHEAVGMSIGSFIDLSQWIRQETPLGDSKTMTLEERLAIFLYIARQGVGYRAT